MTALRRCAFHHPLEAIPTIPTRVRSTAIGLLLVSGAIIACGGGSESVTPPPPPVATVVVTNIPTGPVLIGGSVQLIAVAASATGSSLPGAPIVWSSSDATIASVSTGGLVSAVGAGEVTITATSGGKSGSATLDVRAGASIGTQGGIVSVLGGAVHLDIPPGALPQAVDFLIRPFTGTPADPRLVPGTVFEIAPGNLSFFRGVTFTLRYQASRVPTGLVEPSLQLYRLDGSVWTLIRGSTVATSSTQVSGSIARTGIYAVASTPVHQVSLTGVSTDPALFAGQTLQLGAHLVDANGDSLSGRAVSWSSSNPAVATVAAGRVTAVGAGTTTLAASAEGKTASTSLAVLARPVADWSQATPWNTYQGNAAHTGFMNVTVDPLAFSTAWTTTVQSAVPLNPVVEAAGRVVTTSLVHFGTQKVWALNSATGTVSWSHDFGGVHGVHEPAFDNGTIYLTTSGHGDSYLYAFDAGTGAQRFRSAYENQWSRYYAPVIVNGRVFMAGGYYDGMYAFDASSGARHWFFATNQYNEWTPAVADGVVYAHTGNNSPKVVAVDAITGTQRYEISDEDFSWDGWSMRIAPVLGSQSNLLSTQAGRLISFDLGTRQRRYQVRGEFRGTVAVANDTLYVINGGRLEARRESDGVLVWSWDPKDPLVGPAIITRNIVFVRSQALTYAVDIPSRRSVWSINASGPLTLTSSGLLLIAGSTGSVTAVRVR